VKEQAVFLGFGFVSAQSQVRQDMLLRQKQKIRVPRWLQFYLNRSQSRMTEFRLNVTGPTPFGEVSGLALGDSPFSDSRLGDPSRQSRSWHA